MQPDDSVIECFKGNVGTGCKRKKSDGRLDDVRALHNLFLMEDIVAGAEQGFVLPIAGSDEQWARKHMAEFEKRMEDGDESMGVLLREYKSKL